MQETRMSKDVTGINDTIHLYYKDNVSYIDTSSLYLQFLRKILKYSEGHSYKCQTECPLGKWLLFCSYGSTLIGHGSRELPVLLKLKFYKHTFKMQWLALRAGV